MIVNRRGIMKRGGKAVAVAAMLPVVAGIAGVTVAAPADDMKLLDMWRQSKDLYAKGNNYSISDDEVDKVFAQATELDELIIATPAVTAFGIAIKLQLAVIYEGLNMDVVENPQLFMPRAVVNALDDAERLAGRMVTA